MTVDDPLLEQPFCRRWDIQLLHNPHEFICRFESLDLLPQLQDCIGLLFVKISTVFLQPFELL